MPNPIPQGQKIDQAQQVIPKVEVKKEGKTTKVSTRVPLTMPDGSKKTIRITLFKASKGFNKELATKELQQQIDKAILLAKGFNLGTEYKSIKMKGSEGLELKPYKGRIKTYENTIRALAERKEELQTSDREPTRGLEEQIKALNTVSKTFVQPRPEKLKVEEEKPPQAKELDLSNTLASLKRGEQIIENLDKLSESIDKNFTILTEGKEKPKELKKVLKELGKQVDEFARLAKEGIRMNPGEAVEKAKEAAQKFMEMKGLLKGSTLKKAEQFLNRATKEIMDAVADNLISNAKALENYSIGAEASLSMVDSLYEAANLKVEGQLFHSPENQERLKNEAGKILKNVASGMKAETINLDDLKVETEKDQEKKVKAKNIAKEFYKTEKAFLNQVEAVGTPKVWSGGEKPRTIMEEIVSRFDKKLTSEEKTILTEGWSEMAELSRKLIGELKDDVSGFHNRMSPTMIFDYFDKLTTLTVNFYKALPILKKLEKNEEFQALMKEFKNDKGNTLDAFLITPVQRGPRGRLLLEDMVKNTNGEVKDALINRLVLVKALNKRLNVSVG